MTESSIFAHEGRHAIDAGVRQRLSAADREYRAKLAEVAFAPRPRLAMGAILSASLGDATPHGQANERAMRGVLAWMEKHRAETAGLDAHRPLLLPLPLLSDAQLREAFRAQDPLLRPGAVCR